MADFTSSTPTSVSRRSPIVVELVEEPLLAELKRRARAGWAAGDYAEVARRELWPLGERVVERVVVRAGERVLDVACGTGNAAIRAAEAGGHVAALDLTPELLEIGRELAAEAGVEIDWVEGDAEALPFADGSFDVVVSTLGVMFAPRHRVAAHELVRVLRAGGRLALCNWSEDSFVSRIFRTIATYLPPAPAFAAPPWLWGSEEHIRSLFDGCDLELTVEQGVIEFPSFPSPDEDVEYHTTRIGPMLAARTLTEADGRWPALRAELTRLLSSSTSSDYLLVLGRKLDPAIAIEGA